MTNKLIIRNFGPLVDIRLIIKPYMVLIGPQSTGKSVLAKIISILKDPKFLIGQSDFISQLESFDLKNYLDPTSYIEYDSPAFNFKYDKEKPILINKNKNNLTTIWNSLVENRNNLEKTLSEAHELDKALKKIKFKLKKSNIDKGDPSVGKEIDLITTKFEDLQKHTKEIEMLFNEFKNYSNYSCYIPSERNLLFELSRAKFSIDYQNIPISNTLLNFASKFEKARTKVNKVSVPILENFSYLYENGQDILIISTKKSQIKINVTESSSGLKTIIPLILIIEDFTKSFGGGLLGVTFVIEEPEQNLFPVNQYKLIKYLTKIIIAPSSEKIKNDIIITTHSPYILSSINNLLLAYSLKETKNSKLKLLTEQSVNPDQFIAYYINKGKAKNIFNKKIGLIAENEIDDASDLISNDFSNLMKEYKNMPTNAK